MKDEQKVAFATLGCKLNFSETSSIANQFNNAGYVRVDANKKADVYVINTCTVTEIANKKSRQAIKKLNKINPKAKIVVVGCYSQLKPNEVANIDGVNLILGSENKFKIIDELNTLQLNTNPKIIVNDNTHEESFTPSYSYGDRTRSFLKVQDGCDYFCSYCTIPNARGRSRNNTIKATVAKAGEVVSKGIKEIILTGVNIGDFGKATNEDFFGLVKALDEITGLERLRISSIEPNLLNDSIIEFVSNSKIIVPHFHIPLQCGTDNLLRLMRRRYTINLYKKRVEKIKTLMPEACIAADIIVGVPGETEDEFDKSCNFIKKIDVSYLHVFTYSERENTMAVKMPNQVPMQIRKERSKIMHQIAHEKQKAFHKKHLKTIRKVLFEAHQNKGVMFGFTDNYIKVEVPFNKQLINKIKNVYLESLTDKGTVIGSVC